MNFVILCLCVVYVGCFLGGGGGGRESVNYVYNIPVHKWIMNLLQSICMILCSNGLRTRNLVSAAKCYFDGGVRDVM